MERTAFWMRVGFALGIWLLGGRAHAQQYTLVDLTYEHKGQHRLAPAAGVPSNWSTPVDYRNGRVHGHLEILSRPSNDRAQFTICILESVNPLAHACTASTFYTTARVVDWSHPFSGMWNDGRVTWTKKPVSVALIQKDDKNQNIEPGHALAPRYLPARVRVVVTFVPAGATYQPPGPPRADGGAADTTPRAADAGREAGPQDGSDRADGTPDERVAPDATAPGERPTETRRLAGDAVGGPEEIPEVSRTHGPARGCSLSRSRASDAVVPLALLLVLAAGTVRSSTTRLRRSQCASQPASMGNAVPVIDHACS